MYSGRKKNQSNSDTNIQFYRYISLLGLRGISSIQFTRSTQMIFFLSLHGSGLKMRYFESYAVGGLCIFVLFVRLIGKGAPIVEGSDCLFSPHKFHFNIILPSHSYSKCVLEVFLPNLIVIFFSIPPNVAVQWAPISLFPCFETPFHGSG